MNLLAIETSCDETAVALLDVSGQFPRVLSEGLSSQVELHRPYGGVVPELASRAHIDLLPTLVQTTLRDAQLSISDVSAIAVTQGPGLKGCLLVGLSFAKALSYATQIPLIAVNHLEGHLLAGHLSEERPEFPYLSLLVSGGHTQLVHCREFGDYQIVAETRDDAAGEAFDKIATMLELPYPGGPELSSLARQGNVSRFKLPVAMSGDPRSFSFSGLKTAVRRLISEFGAEVFKDVQLKRDIAASAEWAIVRALVEKSLQAIPQVSPNGFLLTGGVAANSRLQSELSSQLAQLGIPFFVPPRRWCTDNAAMIGAVGMFKVRQSPERFNNWTGARESSNLLGPDTLSSIDALARWPIDSLAAG